MLIKTLKIENFRCFAEVDLSIDVMGLVGVRGRNGAGKSSLLEAIDFALYGQRYGVPSRRSSAGAGEPLRVFVEFEFDGRRVEVQRTADDAWISVDDIRRAETKDETSREVARLLGLSRPQFGATFYARQRELQSFSDTSMRRREIERLLGLSQLRRAHQLAHEPARQQAVVVETLQSGAHSLDEAKRLLEERRERVKQHAPLVRAACERRDGLLHERAAAWAEHEQAQERATEAEQARSRHELAVQVHATANGAHRAAVAAVADAQRAAEEIDELKPLAERAPALAAQLREHELREQAHAAHLAAREARADAQRRRAELADRLTALPAPSPTADELRSGAAQLRARHDALSAQLLEATERAAALGARHEAAKREQVARSRAAELDAVLAELPDARRHEWAARERQAALQAQRAETENRLAAERNHRAEVERDGPDAECPRCRRAYGTSYTTILEGFDATIAGLEEQIASVSADQDEVARAHRERHERLQQLQRLQGERDSLPAFATGAAPGQTARAVEQARQQQDGLRQALQAATTELATAEAQVVDAAERERERQDLLLEVVAVDAEHASLGAQLEAMGDTRYDAAAHHQVADAHREALRAAERCAELRLRAEGAELAQRRAAALQQQLDDAATGLQRLEVELAEHDGADERLEAVQQRLRDMDEAIAAAEDHVRVTEQRAMTEDQGVQAAEAAVGQALAERRKLRAAKRELRYAEAAADGLQQYTAHAQRVAVPTLEKDTGEFLSRLTANRYSDVELDDSGGMSIVDDGAPRPLKRFSGGEQDLANLCLRLALSRAFAHQRTADPGLIILDEVFGSQDLDRRQALLEHFRELNQVFSQVFIVSHFDDVADACDVQIEVRRIGRTSTARLVV